MVTPSEDDSPLSETVYASATAMVPHQMAAAATKNPPFVLDLPLDPLPSELVLLRDSLIRIGLDGLMRRWLQQHAVIHDSVGHKRPLFAVGQHDLVVVLDVDANGRVGLPEVGELLVAQGEGVVDVDLGEAAAVEAEEGVGVDLP